MKSDPSARRRADARIDRSVVAARAAVVIGLAASVGLLIAGDGAEASTAWALDAAQQLAAACRAGGLFPSAAL